MYLSSKSLCCCEQSLRRYTTPPQTFSREVTADPCLLYLDKGYNVFMDNYYTSVALFEEIEERKTPACGTVRSNRPGLPKEICGLKAERKVKQLKRGKSLFRQTGSVTWLDWKPVSVLATTPTSKTDQSVVQCSVKVNGTWEKRDFARPGIINLYYSTLNKITQFDWSRAVQLIPNCTR